MNWLQKALKLAFIAITHKGDFVYHYDKIRDLKIQIEAEKNEIVRLYEQLKAEYEE